MKKTFEVCKVAWAGEHSYPCILLRKRDRTQLGLTDGMFCRVSKGNKRAVAIVSIQFKEHINESKATINTALKDAIDADIGQEITVDTGLLESEVTTASTAFNRMVMANLFCASGRNEQS